MKMLLRWYVALYITASYIQSHKRNSASKFGLNAVTAVTANAALVESPAQPVNNKDFSLAYSSFRCLGGSQAIDTNIMRQATYKKFPLNDPEHRTCLLRNVCVLNGTLFFFQRNQTADEDKSRSLSLPLDFTPQGFDGNMFHTGHLRGFTIPIKMLYGSLSQLISDGNKSGLNFKYSTISMSKMLTFLDANSWTFNYGHYMIDNVIPAFTAAKVFNLPFVQTQQLMETNCRLFSTLEPGFSERKVDYNHSLGTYRQACLRNLENLWPNFFDHAPLYMDVLPTATPFDTAACFSKLIAGQGSTFGLKSLDLTRAVILRDFRDFVLKRLDIPLQPARSLREREKIVLVGLRVAGSAGGVLIKDLCRTVKKALAAAEAIDSPRAGEEYRVECFYPSELSFRDEILAVRRARILISVHGTISYMALFSQELTQQVSVASPKELKENQILPWATHFRTLYLTWDRMDQLAAVLRLCLDAWKDAEAEEKMDS